MAHVIFWEKPGCIGNNRQKALLRRSGHDLDVRNMLTEPWEPERLRRFFGVKPVAEWFNASAPAVKSGAVEPAEMTEEDALAAMIADPVLIRRPLMQVDDERRSGFDSDTVAAWIGLETDAEHVTDACPRDA